MFCIFKHQTMQYLVNMHSRQGRRFIPTSLRVQKKLVGIFHTAFSVSAKWINSADGDFFIVSTQPPAVVSVGHAVASSNHYCHTSTATDIVTSIILSDLRPSKSWQTYFIYSPNVFVGELSVGVSFHPNVAQSLTEFLENLHFHPLLLCE